MHATGYKWIHLLVALALVFAPLRGAWSLPAAAESPDDTRPAHCAQLDQQAEATPHDRHDHDKTGTTGHTCEPGCEGACCDGACNSCVHTAALTGTVTSPPGVHGSFREARLPTAYPKRSPVPPLRPPASP
jgi:hypothetical protein